MYTPRVDTYVVRASVPRKPDKENRDLAENIQILRDERGD